MRGSADVLAPTARKTMYDVIRDALQRLRAQRDDSGINIYFGSALGVISAAHSLSLITLDEADRLYDLANSAIIMARRDARHA